MPDAVLTPGLLADELIGVADVVRAAVHGGLGTRPYSVHLVTRTWAGPRRGEPPVVETAAEILPPPSVPQLGANQLHPTGQDEEGQITITEVSGTFTQDELYPKDNPENVEFYWRLTERHGLGSTEHWLLPVARPKFERGDQVGDAIGWRVQLRVVEPPR